MATSGPGDEQDLVAFLRDRDVACPLCRYNLRGLETARCPECRQPLELTIGITTLRLGWLVALLIPCMFSGIAAFLLLIPMIAAPLSGGTGAPWFVYGIDAFGWLSVLFGFAIYRDRLGFLRLAETKQAIGAVIVWVVHVGLFCVLLVALL